MEPGRCTLRVEGLDCPAEVPPLRDALRDAPGVVGLDFDPAGGTMTVLYYADATDPAALARCVTERARMRAEVVAAAAPPAPRRSFDRRWLATIASGLALGVGAVLASRGVAQTAHLLYLLAIVAGGLDLFPKAWRALRGGRLDIHALMSLAVLGALALGQWDEAATVAFLFGLAEALEALSVERARRAVRALLEVAPESAERIEPDGTARVVDARLVRAGDRVRVRAGERVPVDGTVASGRSSVDQKAITGESVPVLREPGDEVFAGTVNGDGALEVVASRPLDQAIATKVVEQVRVAQAARAPVERGVGRFAAIYTPIVVGLALLVAVAPPLYQLAATGSAAWREWITRGLVVLVVSCPCALVIATPIAVVSALAAAARRGVLVKGGVYLEEFGRLRVLAFDKTGTLTRGEPAVVEVVATGGRADADVLRIAAALGDQGGHVLGRAIARHARGLRLEVPVADDYRAVPGLGASGRVESERFHIGSHRYLDESGLCRPDFHAMLGRAEGGVGTAVALTAPGGPIGWIRLADRPRPEASRVLAELGSLGVEAVMLTGDNPEAAAALAREVGIADQRAGLLPADKAEAVRALDARRGPTGMVGDGVNDAPALAAARVSVALGGISSAAALETADIVLMADDLSRLPWLVRHARRALALIRFNIALAVGIKALFLVLAALGRATFALAIVADLGTSLLVTANALRLLRGREG